jgi:putative oxidoreductase
MDLNNRHEAATSLGLLVLRVGIGGYMMTHGLSKLRMLLAGQAAMIGDPIGIGSEPTLALLVLAELICAGLIVLGAATRLATGPVIVAMAVAAFVAHGNDPWTMEEAAIRFMEGEAQTWSSKQPALMYLLAFASLAMTGAGRYSIDAIAWPRLRAQIGRRFVASTTSAAAGSGAGGMAEAHLAR